MLYIDVTELAGWQGKLTGVPRVMYELSARFDGDKNVGFVKWDSSLREFLIVEFRELKFEQPVHKNKGHTKRNVFKLILRRVWFVRKGLSVARRLLQVASRIRALSGVPEKRVELAGGDMIFILADRHSNDPSFIQRLKVLSDTGVRIVPFCHDMLPVVTPQYAGHSSNSFRYYVENVYPVSSLILVNSKNTKKDIEEWMMANDFEAPEIKVMRLGDDFRVVNPRRPKNIQFLQKKDAKTNFILCVGTVEARKNHAILYYTYKLAASRGIQLLPTLVVGRRGWSSENVYDIITNDPQTKEKIIFYHDCSDEELTWLYKNCNFTIYPSFYEGWGLPIAESLFHGVPCLASNTSSMPEIAGGLIKYFNPFSVDECLNGILSLTDSRNNAEARRLTRRYRPYSWDEAYRQVKNYIKEV